MDSISAPVPSSHPIPAQAMSTCPFCVQPQQVPAQLPVCRPSATAAQDEQTRLLVFAVTAEGLLRIPVLGLELHFGAMHARLLCQLFKLLQHHLALPLALGLLLVLIAREALGNGGQESLLCRGKNGGNTLCTLGAHTVLYCWSSRFQEYS